MSKVVCIRMSGQVGLSTFRFPEGTVVSGQSYVPPLDYLDIIVHHPDLRDVPDEEAIPVIAPLFRLVDGEPPYLELVSWGQEER
jgi:hypothetical protein